MSIDAMKQMIAALLKAEHAMQCDEAQDQITLAIAAGRAAIEAAERKDWTHPMTVEFKQEHVCGLQGFGALDDVCPACTHPQPAIPAGMVLAKVANLIACRDALVDKDRDEAYHQLYTSCDWTDPYSPWAEWEAVLNAAPKPGEKK